MTGHLIIIEGGDGSGKATQTRLLTERLQHEGRQARCVSFPDYDSESSALVKMYLNGDFGRDANSVNPYAASAFYAVDRFASYQTKWKNFLLQGGTVIADRYTTSNMLYQMIKIEDPAARRRYLDWLWDFEFHKMGLPVPDMVILLDVPLAVTEQLMAARMGKTGGQTGDIHEQNESFLKKCHEAYDQLAKQYSWQCISCALGECMRSVEAIHEDVYSIVLKLLKK